MTGEEIVRDLVKKDSNFRHLYCEYKLTNMLYYDGTFDTTPITGKTIKDVLENKFANFFNTLYDRYNFKTELQFIQVVNNIAIMVVFLDKLKEKCLSVSLDKKIITDLGNVFKYKTDTFVSFAPYRILNRGENNTQGQFMIKFWTSTREWLTFLISLDLTTLPDSLTRFENIKLLVQFIENTPGTPIIHSDRRFTKLASLLDLKNLYEYLKK